jgi:hypothetical protein
MRWSKILWNVLLVLIATSLYFVWLLQQPAFLPYLCFQTWICFIYDKINFRSSLFSPLYLLRALKGLKMTQLPYLGFGITSLPCWRKKSMLCWERKGNGAICYFNVPYSREQKHVLLFRKWEILFFKVSNSNMPHISFRNKTFLFVVQMSWNFQHLIILGFRGSSQNFHSFGQLLFFDTPCY